MTSSPPPAIHRRSIDVECSAAIDGVRAVEGRVLDRRYRGQSYVGSHVTRPGVVHDMSVSLQLDSDRGVVSRARGAMQKAAFDGDAETRFESCRDILPNVAGLGGAAVDRELGARIRGAIGRERGCYHLTTLMMATAPVLQRLVDEPLAPDVSLRRHIELDADDAADGGVCLVGRLLESTGAGAVRRARLAFAVDPGTLSPIEVEVELPGDGAAGELARRLAGLPLAAGFARAAIERLNGPDAAEILELALGLSAIVTQAFVRSDAETQKREGRDPPRARNTCWMWRDGGPLQGLATGLGEK